ncbi:hypothetical protein [Streptomyces sp. ISL-94]|uniref:hypothetical protein n=1 Tax=Streptomyces sp. ISL-94 TaxID=2819190 RepID=UPI001BE6BE2E|nr:hypothetical protein [Streptomyces sp. ISL-94]MBT2481555.1 hypothetical protein [Streptomyces sp. ISL-94]
MAEPLALWPVAPSCETDWLTELCGDGTTGFEPPRRPDAAWVLHAMYEHRGRIAGISHHEARQAAVGSGAIEPDRLGDIGLEAGTATGGGLGRAEHPGSRYRRLRWAELSARCGDPVVPEGAYPSLRCFPSAQLDHSWPVGIRPPTEGSLDRPTWDRLVDLLVSYSTDGPDTRCLAYYNPLMLRDIDFDLLRVRAGRLRDAYALYDNPEADFSPSNLWPADRSWVVFTDYDLWATKVVGPEHLVEALLRDPVIEAVRLPWTS